MEFWEEEVQEVFRKVENLLQDAETTLKANGVDTPAQQPNLDEIRRIQFPKGYIRKVSYFLGKYSLEDIVGDETLAKNMAYALQLSDVFNYFLNRFSIGLSAGKLLRKYALVNVVSIIESLLYGSLIQLRKHCVSTTKTVCRMNSDCPFYLKSPNKLGFKGVISELSEKNILSLDDEDKGFLLEAKEHRDNVHMWDLEDNEYKSDYYSLETYNRAILLLGTISAQLEKNSCEFGNMRSPACRSNIPC